VLPIAVIAITPKRAMDHRLHPPRYVKTPANGASETIGGQEVFFLAD